jgi:hypothetical protein
LIIGNAKAELKVDALNDLSIKIDSFASGKLNFIYQLEALPLEYLIVNGKNASTRRCKATYYPAFDCLQTIATSLELKRCQNTYQLNMNMEFEDPAGGMVYLATKQEISSTINVIC